MRRPRPTGRLPVSRSPSRSGATAQWYRARTADVRGAPRKTMIVALGHIIGVDNLLWGSDYPHVESTFPRSRQIIENILTDCAEEEKAKIAGGNASRIYHLN